MLELSESLQRWEDDGGNSADTPNPLSTQRCTHSNREFSDNNGVCPICGNVPYGGGNRDEVYLSDRWCLTPGPSATWDRREFSEAFSALANDFLASPDAVLDFLLNVSNPDSGYIRNPFGELQKKLADLRVKASREEESTVERHCANLEKQCGYLLSRGGDRMSAILRVDAARLDKNGWTGVILEARDTAYSWLKVRSAQQSALMNQAETHSVIPAVADLVSGRLIGQPVVREMNPDERSATAAVSFLDLTKTDPCSNPFHERDPGHDAWKLATRRAEEELAKITPFISEAYDVRLKNETRRSLSEVISVDGGTVTPVSMAPALIPMYGLVFDTWAWRGLVAVARDCDLSAYDEWLVRYARDLVECIGRTKHPEARVIAAGVHQALHGQIGYWKSEARKQLRQQEESIDWVTKLKLPVAKSNTPEKIHKTIEGFEKLNIPVDSFEAWKDFRRLERRVGSSKGADRAETQPNVVSGAAATDDATPEPLMEAVAEEVETGPREPKRGARPIGEMEARQVAEIVKRVAPDGVLNTRVEALSIALHHGICDAADPDACDIEGHSKIPLPRGWKVKGHSWLNPPDNTALLKAIKERLRRAGIR